MMATFDTLTAARHMEAAGMDRKTAEAVAEAIRDGQGELATKADLRVATAELKADIYRALIVQGIAIAGAVIAAIKLI